MPLLDHFHPPLLDQAHWESFHSNWATKLADALNDILPPEFRAEENTHLASLEIDVATYERSAGHPGTLPNGPATVAVAVPTWSPPAPARTIPAIFPSTFEVRVIEMSAGRTLAAAIELVSPGNKDRPDTRKAFAAKCASYLHQGVSLIIMDIVTNRHGNLHNETMRLMNAPTDVDLARDHSLYAVAYRPVLRAEKPEIDLWLATFAIGASLPTMPLRLTGDLFVPVDFEATYQEACRRRRLA